MASIKLLHNQPSTLPRSNPVTLLVVDRPLIKCKLYQKLFFGCRCIGVLNDTFTNDWYYHGNN